RACSACVPWEKFRRATSMPSFIRSRMHSSESQAGPIVQMIFARRGGVTFSGEGEGKWPATRAGLEAFKRGVPPGLQRCATTSTGAEARQFACPYAALKGRSSTAMQTYLCLLIVIRLRGNDLHQGPGKKHGVEFGADQHDQRDEVHPDEQSDAGA